MKCHYRFVGMCSPPLPRPVLPSEQQLWVAIVVVPAQLSSALGLPFVDTVACLIGIANQLRVPPRL